MRDYTIFALILGSLPFCLFRPYIGILVWSWIAYMSPHKLAWGTAVRSFPVAQAVAAATLLGFVISGRDRERLPWQREVLLLALLWIMYTITSFYAIYQTPAWEEWSRTSKILLFTFLTITVCLDRQRLRYLLLTISLSIGFYGFKGGLFSIATGGSFSVNGPDESFITGNTSLGLAMLMVLPMLYYLGLEEQNKKIKRFLQVTCLLNVIAIVFTYSRGALLGLIAVTGIFILTSKRKFLLLPIVAVLGLGIMFFAPSKWFERMNTIQTYEQDASALGRINAWYFAWNLALDRPFTGGGFNTFDPQLFKIYAPNPDDFHDAHSVYFEVLAEHGFVGLALFLSLLFSSILSLIKVKRLFRYLPQYQWICNYCDMLKLSFIAYMVSGAFLGLAYFDLYYHLISSVIILKTLAHRAYATMPSAVEQDEAQLAPGGTPGQGVSSLASRG